MGLAAGDDDVREDREDLARHEREIAAHESFDYAVLDEREEELLGCVYVDPVEGDDADAEVAWWVVDSARGTDLERAVDDAIPAWIASAWPFRNPRIVGRASPPAA